MPSAPREADAPIAGLHRALGLRDLVLMNVSAIFAIQWIATAARIGPASLLLWIVAMLAFFIPSGLCVMELASRHPGEGGLYVWVREAFGDVHGFAVGWCSSIGNLPYFPTVLLFASGVALQIGGWHSAADDVRYHAAFGIALLWIVIGANIVGLERAKWLTNVGAAATAVAIVILLAVTVLTNFDPLEQGGLVIKEFRDISAGPELKIELIPLQKQPSAAQMPLLSSIEILRAAEPSPEKTKKS